MNTTLNGSTVELVPTTTVLCWQCQCKVTSDLIFANYQVLWKGRNIDATRAEYRVLTLLYSNAGQFLTYRQIYDVIQSPGFLAGVGDEGMRGNVRTLIKRLRQKFMVKGSRHDVIENMTAVGYRWKGEDSPISPTAK